MSLSEEIIKQYKSLYFGGNWTSVNLKNTLQDVSRDEAVTPYENLNTIAILVFHINYYITVVSEVLNGGALTGNDKLSFDAPAIRNETEWITFLQTVFDNGEKFIRQLELLPEDYYLQDFIDPKYDTNYRNIAGICEHSHYHLGQIVLIKKLLRTTH